MKTPFAGVVAVGAAVTVALWPSMVRAEDAAQVDVGSTTGATTPENKEEAERKAPALPVTLRPFLQLAGGLKGEVHLTRPTVLREVRATTLMVSRFGLKANVADWIYVESEFEANAGLHGASAWEGQAALQVRNQFVRLYNAKWRLDVGRITDEASIDYFSQHVADFLMADPFTRDPFLYTGYNRGNGVLGAWQPLESLKLALTVNAANPTATSASLAVGGAFFPFERFWIQPWQMVNQGANHYPDDTFHMYVLSPSVQWKQGGLEAQAEAQLFNVNTNTLSIRDDTINGLNLRAGVRAKLAGGRLVPFLNGAYDVNDVVDPQQGNRRIEDKFYSASFGGGVDWNYAGANGVGVQYMRIQFQQGHGVVTSLQYINLGTTYWVHPQVSLGARMALGLKHEHRVGGFYEGETAAYLTVRALLL